MEHINDKNDIQYREAVRKVKRLKSFYTHLTIYILVNLFLILPTGARSVRNTVFGAGRSGLHLSFGASDFWRMQPVFSVLDFSWGKIGRIRKSES